MMKLRFFFGHLMSYHKGKGKTRKHNKNQLLISFLFYFDEVVIFVKTYQLLNFDSLRLKLLLVNWVDQSLTEFINIKCDSNSPDIV